MCVAMPGRVTSIGKPSPGSVVGRVEFGDRTLDINLVMLPGVQIGDHVLCHSGYGVRVVSGEIAEQAAQVGHPPLPM